MTDDNIINDRRFPKDTIRRDDRNASLVQKADGFRQGSTGHSAQDLNSKRHIIKNGILRVRSNRILRRVFKGHVISIIMLTLNRLDV